MARLPRFRWQAIAPTDPLLRWLALDGYGFHQAYFHTRKYVHEQYREPHFPWPADDASGYAARVIDQGIGRAMWFVGGTAPEVVADLLDRYPESRRPDLYAGAGLAAGYAGGTDEAELAAFWKRAKGYQPQVAQGAAFAITARVEADLVLPHTEREARFFYRAPTIEDLHRLTYTEYPSRSEAPVTHLSFAEATERGRNRADEGAAVRLSREAADIFAQNNGGSSAYTKVPIHRIVNDLQTFSLHAMMTPDVNAEIYGRILCGLDPHTYYV